MMHCGGLARHQGSRQASFSPGTDKAVIGGVFSVSVPVGDSETGGSAHNSIRIEMTKLKCLVANDELANSISTEFNGADRKVGPTRSNSVNASRNVICFKFVVIRQESN